MRRSSTAVDHGDRLDEMQGRLEDAAATGTTVIERYQIDDVNVTLLVPFGRQDGLSLGLESRGTVTDRDVRRRRRPAGSSVVPVRHRRSSSARRPADVGSTSTCCHPAPDN